MATVADIMERDPVTVAPGDSVESVIAVLRENELPGVPVVDADGAVAGIITEADLVISDESADLHLPHYIELFGGIVYLEPLKKYHARLKKAVASSAEEPFYRSRGRSRSLGLGARRPPHARSGLEAGTEDHEFARHRGTRS